MAGSHIRDPYAKTQTSRPNRPFSTLLLVASRSSWVRRQLSPYPASCARLSQSSNVFREMRNVDLSGSKTRPTSIGKWEKASIGISIVDSTVTIPRSKRRRITGDIIEHVNRDLFPEEH